MQKANPPRGNAYYTAFFLTGLLVILADQFSKLWIRTNLLSGEVLYSLGFFRVINIRNTGAAFGLFREYTVVLTIFSFIGIAIILVCAFWLPRHLDFLGRLPGRIALGMVLGGTAGNLIDRLFLHYVTDFIDLTYWPAFNVADASVTVGSIWLVFSFLTLASADRHQDERSLSVPGK